MAYMPELFAPPGFKSGRTTTQSNGTEKPGVWNSVESWAPTSWTDDASNVITPGLDGLFAIDMTVNSGARLLKAGFKAMGTPQRGPSWKRPPLSAVPQLHRYYDDTLSKFLFAMPQQGYWMDSNQTPVA